MIVLLTACPSDSPEIELSVHPGSIEIDSDGGSSSFSITSNTSWNIRSESWLTCSPSSGNGNATINLTAQANNTGFVRSFNLEITDRTNQKSCTVKVTQKVAQNSNPTSESTLSVSPSSLEFSADGGEMTVNVKSNTNWSVQERPGWISCNTSGNGDSSLKLTASANTSTDERSGNVKFSTEDGKVTTTITVRQSGTSTSLSLSKGELSFSSSASNNTTFDITSNGSWTVTDDASWLSCSPSEGKGNQTITVTVTENTDQQERSAKISVKSGNITRTINVRQSGVNASLSLSKSELSFTAAASNNTFDITSNSSWTVTDDASWLSCSPTEGKNNQTISVTVSENTNKAERNATITVKCGNLTRTISVKQAAPATPVNDVNIDKGGFGNDSELPNNNGGSTETYSLKASTASLSFTADPASGKTFNITSNDSWIISADSWITVNPSSGSGNSTITVNVTSNPNTTSRSGSITISATHATPSVTISVTQAGKSVTFNATTAKALDFNSSGGTGSITISGNDSWTVTENASWLSCSPTSGTGSGTVYVTVNPRTDTGKRTADIVVKGTSSGITRTFTVTQTGAAVDVNIDKGGFGNDKQLSRKK